MISIEERAKGLLQENGTEKPSDGMVRELVDLIKKKSIVSNGEVETIIAKNAKKSLKKEEEKKESKK